MYLIQLLLPTMSPEDVPFAPALFVTTRAELLARFGGLTAYTRSPAKGAWTAPDGQVDRDEVVMVEVVAATWDKGWWGEYTEILRKRFQQDEIHVRALSIDVLEGSPQ